MESAAKVLAARAVTDEPIVLDYASLGITHTL